MSLTHASASNSVFTSAFDRVVVDLHCSPFVEAGSSASFRLTLSPRDALLNDDSYQLAHNCKSGATDLLNKTGSAVEAVGVLLSTRSRKQKGILLPQPDAANAALERNSSMSFHRHIELRPNQSVAYLRSCSKRQSISLLSQRGLSAYQCYGSRQGM